MTVRKIIGHVVAIVLAVLWMVSSQAHFTARLTADMAADTDKSIKGIHKAFKNTGMSEDQLKYAFGATGLFTAYLLIRRSTRNLGLVMTIVATLIMSVYPQTTVKNLDQGSVTVAVGTLLMATFGLGLLLGD